MKIDLHNHTNFSDGLYTPKELLKRAEENKVDVFAITDHDSIFACNELLELSKKSKTKVILGMELSTYYKGESVHIICLFKNNIIPDEIYSFSYENKERRKIRAIQMMENIQNIYNLKVDIPELLSENEIITRANMLRNIMKHNSLSLSEASYYVSKDSKAYIPSTKMSVQSGLEFAKKAGCVTIFAHPCLVKKEYVEEILKFGFDGMEVRYPSSKNNEEELTLLAKKYNICISAGSDCHGDNTHADIGTCTLNYEEFKPILSKLNIKE